METATHHDPARQRTESRRLELIRGSRRAVRIVRAARPVRTDQTRADTAGGGGPASGHAPAGLVIRARVALVSGGLGEVHETAQRVDEPQLFGGADW